MPSSRSAAACFTRINKRSPSPPISIGGQNQASRANHPEMVLYSRRCRRLIKLALSPTELTRLLENVRENFVRQVGSEDVEGGLSLWGARGLRRRRADALPLLRSSLRPLGSRFPCHCLPQLSKRIYPSDQRTRREQGIIRF